MHFGKGALPWASFHILHWTLHPPWVIHPAYIGSQLMLEQGCRLLTPEMCPWCGLGVPVGVQAASSSKAPAPGNPSRWPVIYTVYINSQRTLKQGRRLPKSKGVDNPTVQEMIDSCVHLKIPVVPEVSPQASLLSLYKSPRVTVQVPLYHCTRAPLSLYKKRRTTPPSKKRSNSWAHLTIPPKPEVYDTTCH